MSEYKINSIKNQSSVGSNFFSKQLNVLTQKVPHILETFVKHYVPYKKFPEDEEYQQAMENAENNMMSIESEMRNMNSDLSKRSILLNKNLFSLNQYIKQYKTENNKYKKQLGIVIQENDSTEEMNSDYTKMYHYEYLRNWGLFFSIVIIAITMKKLFKSVEVKI